MQELLITHQLTSGLRLAPSHNVQLDTMASPYRKMRQDQHLNTPHKEQQQHPVAQNVTAAEFRDQAVSFLASRLMVSQHCPQAASLHLRPSLQKVQEELLSTITSAVQLKQNASLLVLGEPGIGKTLVRGNSLSRQQQLRRCIPSLVPCMHAAAAVGRTVVSTTYCTRWQHIPRGIPACM